MTYAKDLELYDADSHIMELPDFLADYAEPSLREQLANISLTNAPPMSEPVEDIIARGRKHSSTHVAEILDLGDDILRGPRYHDALGAFDSSERTQAIDIIGVKRQLVFGSLGFFPALSPNDDLKFQYGAARAFNRALSDFARADDRMIGVGVTSLDDPQRAIDELDFLLKQPGLGAVMIPHRLCGGRSPGHSELDPFWARLQEARMPFTLHVGGSELQVDSAWWNTGRPEPTDWIGGGENLRSKDILALNHAVELFLSAMVVDGVFKRHSGLTGAVVELGAGWVPSYLTRLDWTVQNWKRTEPELAKLGQPSEVISERVGFTPFVFEDVGELIRQSNPELYLFSTDYPHAEGGRDPLGRFGQSLTDISPADCAKFYAENFKRVVPLATA